MNEEMNMRIDDHAFDQTAEAVFIMNEYARELYASWEELRAFMVSMAYQYRDKSTSFSTGGFHLSFYKSSDGADICVTASVQAYTALKYAKLAEHNLRYPKRLKKEVA
jgi:hypothetical protein